MTNTSEKDASTESADIQRELEQAREQVEAAVQAKSDFLARMSHELRTPLNAIIGLTDLALKTELDTKQTDYLTKVRSASYSLLSIINDVTDFSKMERGEFQQARSIFRPGDVLGRVIELISMDANEKGLEVELSLDPDLPEVLVGDHLRLEQVLSNLASNAVKFTESGRIDIKAELVEERGDEVRASFMVRDTGVGIDPEILPHLFEPFTQADGTVTRRYGGAGIGLTLCKRVADLLEGELTVRSEPGQGSVFTFTLALERGEDESMDASIADFASRRVLAVDDNGVALSLLCGFLRGFSLNPDTAASGELALGKAKGAAASGEPYDLIILDWLMTGMDGIETYRNLKTELGEMCPPVIMLSAHSRREVVRQAEKEGVSAFLFKPVTRSLLQSTISQIFSENEPVGAETAPTTAPAHEDSSAVRGMSILVVEDNPINQQVVSEVLESWGAGVTVADNGAVALEKLDADTFDAVLMDIQMPGMDGFETTSRILKVIPDMPVIALSAHTMNEEREKGEKVGMKDFIIKPLDPDILYRALLPWAPENVAMPEAGPVEDSKKEAAPDKGVAADSLESIPGLDAASGIKRVAGNRGLYLSLLNEFTREYENGTRAIGEALENGDRETALRLAHTIKGVAGNVSAQQVHKAALMLEQAIRKGRDEDVGHLMAGLETELNFVVGAVKAVVGAPDGPQRQEPAVEADVPPLKVLLADDARSMRMIFASLLQEQGHEVDMVENGREAFRTLYRQWRKDRPYDLVILDIEMPVMGGMEAARRIRKYKPSKDVKRFDPDLPIIAISAHTDRNKLDEILSSGIDYCIHKAVDSETLAKTVARAWKEKLSPDKGAAPVAEPVPTPPTPVERERPHGIVLDLDGDGLGEPQEERPAREVPAVPAGGLEDLGISVPPEMEALDGAELVEALSGFLRRHSLDSEKCFLALKAKLDSAGHGPDLARLGKSIAVFDYQTALNILNDPESGFTGHSGS